MCVGVCVCVLHRNAFLALASKSSSSSAYFSKGANYFCKKYFYNAALNGVYLISELVYGWAKVVNMVKSKILISNK